jgi:molybdopterin synthase catalytic subunit
MSVIRLLRIQPEPLDLAEVVAAVSDGTAGGLTVFVGTVRDHDEGRSVTGLEYSAHPTALARLEEVAERVAAKHDLIALAAVHRVGELQIGDAAVIVAAAAAHRGEAFDGSRDLIDDLKDSVPIWKHQLFSDGTEEWVGTP